MSDGDTHPESDAPSLKLVGGDMLGDDLKRLFDGIAAMSNHGNIESSIIEGVAQMKARFDPGTVSALADIVTAMNAAYSAGWNAGDDH